MTLPYFSRGTKLSGSDLRALSRQVLSDLVGDEYIHILRTGNKAALRLSIDKLKPMVNTVGGAWAVFKLTGGPSADGPGGEELYTARKQTFTDFNTSTDASSTDYYIYFAGVTEKEADALPSAATGQPANGKMTVAFYLCTNSSGDEVWQSFVPLPGGFNLVVHP